MNEATTVNKEWKRKKIRNWKKNKNESDEWMNEYNNECK